MLADPLIPVNLAELPGLGKALIQLLHKQQLFASPHLFGKYLELFDSGRPGDPLHVKAFLRYLTAKPIKLPSNRAKNVVDYVTEQTQRHLGRILSELTSEGVPGDLLEPLSNLGINSTHKLIAKILLAAGNDGKLPEVDTIAKEWTSLMGGASKESVSKAVAVAFKGACLFQFKAFPLDEIKVEDSTDSASTGSFSDNEDEDEYFEDAVGGVAALSTDELVKMLQDCCIVDENE